MNLFQTYHDYFKALAIAHPDLGHTEASKAFELIAVEEAFGDYRSTGNKGTVMRLLELSYAPRHVDSLLRVTQGGFMILAPHSNRTSGSAGMISALSIADRITSEIIHKMMADSRGGHYLFDYSMNTGEGINVSMSINSADIGFSGFVTSFTISPNWNVCLTDDPFLVNNWMTPDDEFFADWKTFD